MCLAIFITASFALNIHVRRRRKKTEEFPAFNISWAKNSVWIPPFIMAFTGWTWLENLRGPSIDVSRSSDHYGTSILSSGSQLNTYLCKKSSFFTLQHPSTVFKIYLRWSHSQSHISFEKHSCLRIASSLLRFQVSQQPIFFKETSAREDSRL